MLRRPRAVQIPAKTGANTITNTEFTDWSHSVGICQPRMERSVKSRPNRLSDVGACSYADQNVEEKRNSTRMTTARFSSSRERPAKKNR